MMKLLQNRRFLPKALQKRGKPAFCRRRAADDTAMIQVAHRQ
ncbi:hypothetical protein [Brevibacillus gelatini]